MCRATANFGETNGPPPECRAYDASARGFLLILWYGWIASEPPVAATTGHVSHMFSLYPVTFRRNPHKAGSAADRLIYGKESQPDEISKVPTAILLRRDTSRIDVALKVKMYSAIGGYVDPSDGFSVGVKSHGDV